jgi:hypothetical protein
VKSRASKGIESPIDPGFGFGKTVEHNFTLLKRLPELAALGLPVVAGWSRKSTLGAVTGQPVGERLAASLAAALLAVQHGAKILRVHDVRETRDALAVVQTLGKGMSRKYFGTDGVRGTVGKSPMTPDLCCGLAMRPARFSPVKARLPRS